MDQSFTESLRTEPQRIILPILVLYNMRLSHSATYQTFVASSCHGGLDQNFIAVYDNGPTPQVNPAEESHLFAYKHDPDNSGIAAAYNWALEIAHSHGFLWLLLLDQDTRLPPPFLASLLGLADLHATNQSVAAIVPYVTDKGAMISPRRVCFARLGPLPEPSPAVAESEVTAINSGAAIKVSFVRSLGGFNLAYRLDCLDHWLFRQLYARGKRVALSGSVLEHKLSVSDYRNQVSLTRYRSILSAEALFVTTEKRRPEIPMYVIRLMLRAVKQLVVYRRPELAALTCAMIPASVARLARSLLRRR